MACSAGDAAGRRGRADDGAGACDALAAEGAALDRAEPAGDRAPRRLEQRVRRQARRGVPVRVPLVQRAVGGRRQVQDQRRRDHRPGRAPDLQLAGRGVWRLGGLVDGQEGGRQHPGRQRPAPDQSPQVQRARLPVCSPVIGGGGSWSSVRGATEPEHGKRRARPGETGTNSRCYIWRFYDLIITISLATQCCWASLARARACTTPGVCAKMTSACEERQRARRKPLGPCAHEASLRRFS
eukprot:3131112-Rhodomonas_salina.1